MKTSKLAEKKSDPFSTWLAILHIDDDPMQAWEARLNIVEFYLSLNEVALLPKIIDYFIPLLKIKPESELNARYAKALCSLVSQLAKAPLEIPFNPKKIRELCNENG